MSVVSFALAVVFIIRLFSTSAFRVPNFSVALKKIVWDQTALRWVTSRVPRPTGGSRSLGRLLNNVIWNIRSYLTLVYVFISFSFCFASPKDERPCSC